MRRLIALLFVLLMTALPAWAGVDVNNGSSSELESLPGIGPSKAAAIIEYRTQHGPFTSVKQLDDVPGIGPSTLANIRGLVVLGDGVAPATGEEEQAPPTTASPSGSANKVNINTAGAGELESLPGIGPSKSAAILEDRNANGPFSSCDDLQRVRGIGSATVASLRDSCTVQ